MTMLATRWRWRLFFGVLSAGWLPLTAAAQTFDWSVEVTPAGELFPVLDLTQRPRAPGSNPGGGSGLVAVRVSGTLPDELRLRIETAGLREPAHVDWRKAADESRRTLDLHPYLDWDADRLRGMNGARTQVLKLTLTTPTGSEIREIPVRVHALEDVPYFVREGGEQVDLGWVFAGYVDPQAAVVDAVLALARRTDPGLPEHHAARDPALALRSVAAVWQALEQHGMRYDAGDPALSRGPVVWSQRVRLADEAWRERRANCIDGSVLIASVLERLGLAARIVLVPGHAFVGYRNADGSAEYLETTVLGLRGGLAQGNFAAARLAGKRSWRRASAKLDGRHGPDYALIDIARARQLGIIPLSAEREPVAQPASRIRVGARPRR
ncbi:MAG: hypothetical protein K8F35_03195 [Dokdonella sp.]|uniref:hypothetical protein n=1 Tax=Dokdonella sp. TaxID=2291710 RepID=UPI0025BE0D6F|nr:hypothetical protein [Dokdonella sp.]MBZ0222012.1 hypothetical protein [Dokdonella sp.]